MGDLRISSLPRKAALANTDLIPIVDLQFGAPNYVNKKTTVGDFIAIITANVGQTLGAVTSVNGQTGAVVLNLATLPDTSINSVVNGDVLRYDSAVNRWVNTQLGDFAPLVDGLVPADYLPSYVDDVLEYADLASFPETGETGKIYVAVDTKRTYRWSGSVYIEISPGSVTSVAGKTGAVQLTEYDIGGSVEGTTLADDLSNLSDLIDGKATYNHTHGNITTDGRIGDVGGLVVITGDNGALITSSYVSQATALFDLPNDQVALSLSDGVVTLADGYADGLRTAIGAAALVDGKVPLEQLPPADPQVLEFGALVLFPEVGEPGKIYVEASTNYLYRWDGSAYAPIGDSNALGQNITVKAVNQGAYSDGAVIPAGTSFETILKNMLQTVVPATYTQPTLGLSSTPSTLIYEYGASVNAAFTLSWTKNDAGNATQFRLSKNGVVVHTVTASTPGAAHSESFTLTANTAFTAAADYSQGAQKYDNMGNPSGSPISSGTIAANTLTFIPRHKRYWGVSTATSLDSAGILGLTSSELSTSRAQNRSFNTAGQYIYFAWPSSFGDASFNVNGLPNSAWIKTTLSFINSSGYSEPYTVYRSQYLSTGDGIAIQVS